MNKIRLKRLQHGNICNKKFELKLQARGVKRVCWSKILTTGSNLSDRQQNWIQRSIRAFLDFCEARDTLMCSECPRWMSKWAASHHYRSFILSILLQQACTALPLKGSKPRNDEKLHDFVHDACSTDRSAPCSRRWHLYVCNESGPLPACLCSRRRQVQRFLLCAKHPCSGAYMRASLANAQL